MPCPWAPCGRRSKTTFAFGEAGPLVGHVDEAPAVAAAQGDGHRSAAVLERMGQQDVEDLAHDARRRAYGRDVLAVGNPQRPAVSASWPCHWRSSVATISPRSVTASRC